MADCIFCKMVEGEIPARTVYEDAHVLAFLDINPLAEGHTLVIPKDHVERIGELSPDGAASFFHAVPGVVQAVEDGVGADGATVAFNDGEAAGQEVPHTHLHVVPRSRGDRHGPIHALFSGQLDANDADLDRVQKQIRSALS